MDTLTIPILVITLEVDGVVPQDVGVVCIRLHRRLVRSLYVLLVLSGIDDSNGYLVTTHYGGHSSHGLLDSSNTKDLHLRDVEEVSLLQHDSGTGM